MSTAVIQRDLTDEGKILWDNLSSYETILSGGSVLPKVRQKRIRIDYQQIEIDFLRLEIKRLIKNSEMVVEDCDRMIALVKDKNEYLACDAKVAKMIHLNNIKRLERILNNQPAFDHEIKIPD